MTDSQVALTALKSITINSRVVANCFDSLAALAEHNRVTLKFVAVYQGIEGNIKENLLAKKGTSLRLIGTK